MSVEENKAVIRSLQEGAMNRHDVDACVAFFSEDTTNHGRPGWPRSNGELDIARGCAI